MGIQCFLRDDNLVRLSVGVEDVSDLQSDLRRALTSSQA